MRPLLYIGDKNISSWSLRPWLALAVPGIPFDEEVLRLNQPNTQVMIAPISPSRRVPCLLHGAVKVWESLAICEYVAETWPEANLWPIDPLARAAARSVSTEIHSGFAALRNECSMAINQSRPTPLLSEQAQQDIKRIVTLWSDCRDRFGHKGPYLFGHFSIADAMYAPVVTRFTTYSIDVPVDARRYMDTVWALPAMQRWKAAALL